ncbi:hypothetical protein HG535_0A05340 [Zygotorulaspora mrakii]|uniref:PH domain-containing protein n=1 Tax=Zygotorulaspora mrakii TaxID=42260 RepID=A0A7H9AWI7_ZYGMR|nr:uncharacterized protein HG535_0A05340 [Zygotorulaspora mrakii]QLG70593.1 hypothetical protein HG535_0A05340 [Zygotorulaspora mrakii]
MTSHYKDELEELNLLLSARQDTLSRQDSLRCYKILYSGTMEYINNDAYADMMCAFILNCESSVLCEKAVINRKFWEVFKSLIEALRPEPFSKCLNTIFSAVLEQQRIFVKALDSLCEHILSDGTILSAIAAILASREAELETNIAFFRCISQLQDLLVRISNYQPQKAATYIPLYKLISLQCRLFYVMTPHLVEEPIRNMVIQGFLPVRKDLYEYLRTVAVDDYPTPLKKRFDDIMDSTFMLSAMSKAASEEINEMHEDFLHLNMLQGADITAFLENPNLSFKKTFAEQLIFNGKPFPLLKSASYVSICLNELFDSFEKDINEKPHLAGFILNKNYFMYALMDRLLKSWVESKGETEKDMSSLLKLMPIILHRIKRATSDPMGLTFEELVSLALNTIRSLDYRSSRELQLNDLREGYYKKWSRHLLDFETMLSDQVNDFVLHQRLLQLQKGTWVYGQNPVDPSIKTPSILFMILSVDQNNLLVREFGRITEILPAVEGNVIHANTGKSTDAKKTLVVPMNSISKFEAQEVAATDNTPKDSHLISCVKKNVYTEVKFLDKNSKCILRVFFDTKEAIYVWLDGLQLVASAKHRNGISEATKEQKETLVDIRRTVQMMNLNIKEAFEAPDTSSSDEDFYNVDTLKGLTADFYYEQDVEQK